jgi:hypothetical protein
LEVIPGELATDSANPKTRASASKKSKEILDYLSFEADFKGQFNDVNSFVQEIQKVAPLMELKEIKVSGNGLNGSLSLKAGLAFPYLALPTVLGKIESQLEPITPEEQAIYQNLVKLNFTPSEKEVLTVPSGKENPFTF